MAVPESNVPLWLPWAGQGIITLFMGLFAWLGKRHIDRVDGYEKRISSLERGYLSREEFRVYMEEVRSDRRAMHDENQASIAQLRRSVDDVTANLIKILLREQR